jgi:hypothetical protein
MFKLYLRKNPLASTSTTFTSLTDYIYASVVFAPFLEAAYEEAQNLDGSRTHRSASVGDLLVDPIGNMYVIEMTGFTKVN